MLQIRALVVDDSAPMREAIRSVLQSVPGCDIVGEGVNGMEVLDLAKELNPDLIVMDINMPLMGGMEATRFLKEQSPQTEIVLVTSIIEPETLNEALNVGARACLDKGAGLWHELPAIVRKLCQARSIQAS